MTLSTAVLVAVGALFIVACGDDAKRDTASASTARTIAVPRRELAAGTAIDATIQDSITSRGNSVGDPVRAIVSRHVLDDSGRTMISAGAMVALRVAALHHGSAGAADAIVTLAVVSIADGATTYAPSASAGRVGFALRPGKSPLDDRELFVTAGTPVSIRLTNALGITAQ